jgi:hypothetical protein
MPPENSFFALPTTSNSRRRIPNWRRNTGYGPSLLIVADVWTAIWQLAGLGIIAFGAVVAVHDVYLNSILIETTCQVLDTHSEEEVVHEPRQSRNRRPHVFFRSNSFVQVQYEVGEETRKIWLPPASAKIADYPIDSIHPLFYSTSFPATVRLSRPNPGKTFATSLAFATPFLFVAFISSFTLRHYTRERRQTE